MTFRDCIHYFELDNVTDPKVRAIPFLQRILPYIVLTARTEAAAYYTCDSESLTQDQIIKFLIKYREYDGIEVSKIVENWRKEYGVNE